MFKPESLTVTFTNLNFSLVHLVIIVMWLVFAAFWIKCVFLFFVRRWMCHVCHMFFFAFLLYSFVVSMLLLFAHRGFEISVLTLTANGILGDKCPFYGDVQAKQTTAPQPTTISQFTFTTNPSHYYSQICRTNYHVTAATTHDLPTISLFPFNSVPQRNHHLTSQNHHLTKHFHDKTTI